MKQESAEKDPKERVRRWLRRTMKVTYKVNQFGWLIALIADKR